MQSNKSERDGPPTEIARGRFLLQQRLGGGMFAEVYRGLDRRTGTSVAIKLEDSREGEFQVEREARFMADLAKPTLPQGFARCFHYGQEGIYTCLVMDLLGSSLEDYFCECGGRFTVLTTTLIAQQGLTRLRYLHSKGIIHRDIKPENFLMGVGVRSHHLYIVDFGLSKRYYDERHVAMKSDAGIVGTPRYASINALRGREQSRRDDLEAFGYLLVRFCRGGLPWSGLGGDTPKEKYRRILAKKEATRSKELCEGLPSAFPTYLRLTRCLEFEDKPNYEQLLGLWAELRADGQPAHDHDLEWLSGKGLHGFEPLELMDDVEQPDERSPSLLNPFAALADWFNHSCSATAARCRTLPRMADHEDCVATPMDDQVLSDESNGG